MSRQQGRLYSEGHLKANASRTGGRDSELSEEFDAEKNKENESGEDNVVPSAVVVRDVRSDRAKTRRSFSRHSRGDEGEKLGRFRSDENFRSKGVRSPMMESSTEAYAYSQNRRPFNQRKDPGRRGRDAYARRSGNAADDSRESFRERRRQRSPSIDSVEEYRRSRSRERKRRHTQYLTMQKSRSGIGEASQVFWDGFQWVKKGDGTHEYDQEMNSTRRARRLHIGNLPLIRDVTEEDFKTHLWAAMMVNGMCPDASLCPILHVWFARDRGGTFGFIEMASVESAHSALSLDGMAWKGATIRINRPTDWKSPDTDKAIEVLAGPSGFNLAVAESLAAAAHQAKTTGNTGGLMKLVSSLPEDGQKAITEMMSSQSELPVDRSVDLVREKIKAELLVGAPTRVVRIEKPSSATETEEECKDLLEEMRQQCEKEGMIVSILIITPERKDVVEDIEVGDVFVEFAKTSSADDCILNVSGRLFDGKPVKICRFDQAIWKTSLKQYAENLFLKNLKCDQ